MTIVTMWVYVLSSPFFFFFNFYLFIYLFFSGCFGSSFLCQGFLRLWQAGATLHRGERVSHYRGLSCCGAQAPDAQAQQSWLTGLVAPWHVGSSQTRARTRVPCISRQILNHCATREALFKNSLYQFSMYDIFCKYFSLILLFAFYHQLQCFNMCYVAYILSWNQSQLSSDLGYIKLHLCFLLVLVWFYFLYLDFLPIWNLFWCLTYGSNFTIFPNGYLVLPISFIENSILSWCFCVFMYLY